MKIPWKLMLFFCAFVINVSCAAFIVKKPWFAFWWMLPTVYCGVILAGLTDSFLLPAFMAGDEVVRLIIKMLIFPWMCWTTIALRRICAYKFVSLLNMTLIKQSGQHAK